jgi:hypothetical protein
MSFFLLLQNQRTGGQNRYCLGLLPVGEKDVGKGRRRVNMEQILGVVVCACHPSEGEKPKIGELWSRPAWGKK